MHHLIISLFIILLKSFAKPTQALEGSLTNKGDFVLQVTIHLEQPRQLWKAKKSCKVFMWLHQNYNNLK
jgi:hypothetical protein